VAANDIAGVLLLIGAGRAPALWDLTGLLVVLNDLLSVGLRTKMSDDGGFNIQKGVYLGLLADVGVVEGGLVAADDVSWVGHCR
jgi:hypothetical protein